MFVITILFAFAPGSGLVIIMRSKIPSHGLTVKIGLFALSLSTSSILLVTATTPYSVDNAFSNCSAGSTTYLSLPPLTAALTVVELNVVSK